VTGPVNLDRGTSVTLGNPRLGCDRNTVTGPVTVTNTAGWNVIGGNTIVGTLNCAGNTPAPVNNNAPNSVVGRKTGQCATL
jgi:hypothetical protein